MSARLTLPTIHLNGTSQQALAEQLEIAGIALRVAVDAVVEAQPNGRDYYPQGPDAFQRAQNEHNARVTALQKVLTELQTLHESIALWPHYVQEVP